MNSLPVSMDHYYMGVKEVNMEQLEETYKMKVWFKVLKYKRV